MDLPILQNHNSSKRIGWLRQVENHLRIEFDDGCEITRDMFFSIFGECGFRAEFTDETMEFIKTAYIFEFSITPNAKNKGRENGITR